jgi:hypothetical protein
MLVEKQHASLETDDNLLVQRGFPSWNVVGIENRFPTFASRCG